MPFHNIHYRLFITQNLTKPNSPRRPVFFTSEHIPAASIVARKPERSHSCYNTSSRYLHFTILFTK
ncbi:hypothetical protein HanHA89_Chr12g0457951 [Helianthus annuus]|nr:hypothetical protein HanHA89_Chr12g0457951 [Helianthus annuus]